MPILIDERFRERKIGTWEDGWLKREHIEKLFDSIIKAYTEQDKEALKEAYRIEDEIDDITAEMDKNHIIRLNAGICTAIVGSQYMSLASNAERVADHFINVGKMINEW